MGTQERPNVCGIRFSQQVIDFHNDAYIAVRNKEELQCKIAYLSGFHPVDILPIFRVGFSEGHSLKRLKPLMDELAPVFRADHVPMAKACGYDPNTETLKWEFMECASGEWRYCIQAVKEEQHEGDYS